MNNRPWTDEELRTLKIAYNTRPENQTDKEFAIGYAPTTKRSVEAVRIMVAKIGERREPEAPKILYFDIETLPIIAYTWRTWDVTIHNEQIIKDWCVLSWAAQWEGGEVFGDVLTPSEAVERSDQRLIGGMWKLLDRADIVVSQNGRKFDHKKLNARFVHHKMTPPAPYKTIDTLAAARSVAGFTSNKLDWLARETGVSQRKDDTSFELWKDCDNGKTEALAAMLHYNLGDVEELRAIYHELRPWIPGHPNVNMYAAEPSEACPVCGGEIVKAGNIPTNKRKRKAFRCVDCGCTGVWP